MFERSIRNLRSAKQAFQIELDGVLIETRFADIKGTLDVSWRTGVSVRDFDHREDELLGLVQGGNDLLAREHHAVSAIRASLDFDEAMTS